MAGKSSKKKSKSLTPHQPTALGLSLTRAGMPALDSVVAIFPLAPSGAAVGVTGTKYRIIRTTEVDGYEPIATSQGDIGVSLAAAAPPTGDKFQGTDRKAAKLSIVKKKPESFTDLRPLINSLTEESQMVHHVPKITKDSTMNRVDEEKRNVSVRAFLYAASRENDNDFHLIVGRDPAKTPEMYMTMELSGLPPLSSPHFKKLKSARDSYKTFFADNLPGLSYDFYDPPIPIDVAGSLFFDVTHSSGQRPGPKSLKSRMPVIWEVHPITTITFEP